MTNSKGHGTLTYREFMRKQRNKYKNSLYCLVDSGYDIPIGDGWGPIKTELNLSNDCGMIYFIYLNLFVVCKDKYVEEGLQNCLNRKHEKIKNIKQVFAVHDEVRRWVENERWWRKISNSQK